MTQPIVLDTPQSIAEAGPNQLTARWSVDDPVFGVGEPGLTSQLATSVYDTFRYGLLNGDYDLDTAGVKVALVAGYTFDASHTTVADIVAAGGVINGVSAALTGTAATGGVVDADDAVIATTASTAEHHLLIFQAGSAPDTDPALQRLIGLHSSGYGLPVKPGEGTVTVAWTNKILQL